MHQYMVLLPITAKEDPAIDRSARYTATRAPATRIAFTRPPGGDPWQSLGVIASRWKHSQSLALPLMTGPGGWRI